MLAACPPRDMAWGKGSRLSTGSCRQASAIPTNPTLAYCVRMRRCLFELNQGRTVKGEKLDAAMNTAASRSLHLVRIQQQLQGVQHWVGAFGEQADELRYCPDASRAFRCTRCRGNVGVPHVHGEGGTHARSLPRSHRDYCCL